MLPHCQKYGQFSPSRSRYNCRRVSGSMLDMSIPARYAAPSCVDSASSVSSRVRFSSWMNNDDDITCAPAAPVTRACTRSLVDAHTGRWPELHVS